MRLRTAHTGGHMKRIVVCSILAAALLGCVSTPFKGVQASALNDDQLITELSSVYQQLGMSTGLAVSAAGHDARARHSRNRPIRLRMSI